MWSSQHLEIDTMSGRLIDPNDEYDEFYNNYEEDYENEGGYDFLKTKEKIQNVISTPFGLWRVHDVMNPYKQFKLWMGHTNFTINQNVADTIKSVPGVEVLSILTRYRFLIGIGEMFDIRNVRSIIEKKLKCPKNNKNNNRKTVNETQFRSKT
jgi:hypothetical protein